MKRLQQILGRKHQRNLHVCIHFTAIAIFPITPLSHPHVFLWSAGNICPPSNCWTENSNFCSATTCRWRGTFFLSSLWYFTHFIFSNLLSYSHGIYCPFFRRGRRSCMLIDSCSYSDMYHGSSWPSLTLYSSELTYLCCLIEKPSFGWFRKWRVLYVQAWSWSERWEGYYRGSKNKVCLSQTLGLSMIIFISFYCDIPRYFNRFLSCIVS